MARSSYIIESGKRITWKETSKGIEFSDGKSSLPNPSNMDAKLAYKSATGVVVPPIVVPPVIVPPVVVNPPEGFKIVGEGTGALNLGVIKDVRLKIKAGMYNNISWDKATNCVIDASEVEMPRGWIDLKDTTNVEFYGLSLYGQTYRAISIRGLNTGLRIHHMKFKDIGNNVITFEWDGKTYYDGSEGTVNRDSSITDCTFEGIKGPVSIDGGFRDGKMFGLSSGFKFQNNTLVNSPTVGNWFSGPVSENIEVSGNTIDKINSVYTDPKAVNGGHVGIFSITGNGSVHSNKCTNHQGNITRFWGFNPTGKKYPVKVYDNLVFNSWKYGAIEIQVPPFLSEFVNANKDKVSYTDYEVYNNTAGQLNNSLDWEGQMLDFYNVYGAVKYYNNLGFKMNKVFNVNGGKITKYEGITNMINWNGNGTSFEESNNKYFNTYEEAMAYKKANPSIGSSLTL